MLKPAYLEDKIQTVEITNVSDVDPEFAEFSDVQLSVLMNGLDFVWPIATDKSVYMAMHDRFGSDPKDWIGQRVRIRTMFSRKLGQDYIEVVREASTGRRETGGRR